LSFYPLTKYVEVNVQVPKFQDGFRQQKLQDISITSRRGIFSPLTPNGRIIVNDMLASCYSDVNEATLQNTYFSVRNQLNCFTGFRIFYLYCFSKMSVTKFRGQVVSVV
ncbi:unnamed protein product, partial [Angiostrongylus costaricensis]|uniref:HintC domain-containing protein n=1 Tax=Angiostrongylus costaricensis TaxID=334426 RepID=A0A0R3PDJ8_ANGCS